MLRNTYTHAVYPVSGYKFGQKAAKPEKDGSTQDRLARIRAKYDREGLRRSVDAVLLVQQHGHPHVLLLQLGSRTFFKLPGGKLRPGEDETEGLRRKLAMYLSPDDPVLQMRWEIGECLGAWWRPNFDTVLYPYLPPHITRPKEVRRLFLVPLVDNSCFSVPSNYKLVAVPLFELYDNIARFGPMLASLPQMLCRLRLNVVGAAGAAKAAAAAVAAAAAAAPQQQQQQRQQQQAERPEEQQHLQQYQQQQQLYQQQQQQPQQVVMVGGVGFQPLDIE